MDVLGEEHGEVIGMVAGIVVHPDNGKVEAFSVRERRFFRGEELYLVTSAVRHIGRRITVRSADDLAPLSDLVRLRAVMDDGRTVVGQRMVTESGRFLGVCRDVQFDAEVFQVQWLFPRGWLRWRPAVPLSSVLEIRGDAIVVRDLTLKASVFPAEAVFPGLDALTTPGVTKTMRRE